MNFDLKTISIGSFAALALLAAPLAMTHSVHAQGRGEGGGPRGNRFEQLNLTEDQSAQIESIRANSRTAMQALLTAEQRATLESSDSEGRRAWKELGLTDAQRTEARAIREASREQIQGVLTDTQRQQLAQAGGGHGRGHGGARGHGGSHLEQLNLTEDQSAQIESIRDMARGQMEAVLTAEQQATLESSAESDGRRGFRELDLSEDQRSQLRAIREATRAQVQDVLTEDQRQQMEEIRGERGNRQ